MTKKIVVYTAIFGAYDSQLIEVEYDKEKFDFICFTNLKRLKSKTWDIKYVENDPVPNDNPRSAYYYKTNPHVVLPDYDVSIWMDSSCNRLDIEKLYKLYEKFEETGKALYIEKHPGRNCVYEELKACIHYKKDDEQAMIEHVESYRKDGMPENTGLVETGLQIRKHNEEDVIEFQEMLWKEMITKTRRDQLSWNYCAWKLNFTNYALFSFQEKIDVLWFQDHPHRPKHKEKVLMVGPWYGDERLEDQWVEYIEEYVGKTPVDTIIVACRPDREKLYESIKPDKIVVNNPIGIKNKNLLNGRVPTFNVKTSDEKEVIQLNPTNQICNDFHLFDRSKSKIRILWCTIRPSMFNDTHKEWMKASYNRDNVVTYCAVDKPEQKDEIYDDVEHKVITYNKRQGVTYPSYAIAQHLLNEPDVRDDDIVIFASDDFYPMPHWDKVLLKEYEMLDNALVINDCYGPQGKSIVSIPIMTVGCLRKTKGIIYHPAYTHCYADNELSDVLKELNLLTDISLTKPEVYLEHRHFSSGKRELDDVDKYHQKTSPGDMNLYLERRKLPISERLRVDEKKDIKLSILICSLENRRDKYLRLTGMLNDQFNESVEILSEIDNCELTIGEKRQKLLERAIGEYICFVDDDDTVCENYIELILNAIKSNPDCCSLIGQITINGQTPQKFIHSINYTDWYDEGEGTNKVYYRCPNHLNAVKRELALQAGFKSLNHGEDRVYSKTLFPLLKTEAKIEDVLYYYDAWTNK